jgi:hypothetical protein
MDVVYTIFPNLFIVVCVNDKHNYWKSAAMTNEWQRLAAFQTPYSAFNEIWMLYR